MRGSRAFMAEPERNNGDIVPGLKQMHGRGVAHDMRGNGPAFQGRASTHSLGDSTLQTGGNAKAG